MLIGLLSKGFETKIKHCQMTERVRRDKIYKPGLSGNPINIDRVKAHLTKESGFQK